MSVITHLVGDERVKCRYRQVHYPLGRGRQQPDQELDPSSLEDGQATRLIVYKIVECSNDGSAYPDSIATLTGCWAGGAQERGQESWTAG